MVMCIVFQLCHLLVVFVSNKRKKERKKGRNLQCISFFLSSLSIFYIN